MPAPRAHPATTRFSERMPASLTTAGSPTPFSDHKLVPSTVRANYIPSSDTMPAVPMHSEHRTHSLASMRVDLIRSDRTTLSLVAVLVTIISSDPTTHT